MSAVPSHDHHLFAPLRAQEDAQARIEARESATARRFAELLADDDAVLAAWATGDEVGTTVDVLGAVRERNHAANVERGAAFLAGMVQSCRDTLWKQAQAEVDGGNRAPVEPQTELVRAARFALASLDGPLGTVTPDARRRLEQALAAFSWVSA